MLQPWWSAARRGIVSDATGILKRSYIQSTRSSSTVAQLLRSRTATSSPSDSHPVTVNGFVRSVRKQKRVAFAVIDDGSSFEALQAVLTPEQAKDLSTGTAISIKGKWQPSPSGREQTHELQVEEVKVLGENDADSYPIQKKFHTSEFLRSLPHLRARIPYNSLLLRLRSEAIAHVSKYFSAQGYIQTHPPIITSSDCEGAGEVFAINSNPSSHERLNDPGGVSGGAEEFFRTSKYLTVSSQLHLEALAQSVGKVWTLSPTFRAERSDTPRHLSEFYMLEAETSFVKDVNQVMDVVEGLLRELVTGLQASPISEELLSACTKRPRDEPSDSQELQLETRWQSLVTRSWPRITYAEAISILRGAMSRQQAHFDFAPQLGSSLQAEHEKYLAETVGCGGPVFVTDYPRDTKAFYMAPSATEQPLPTVACFDLLVPELCEIVGGSMREHRLEFLLRSMSSHGLLGESASPANQDAQVATQDLAANVPPALQWYVDLRRYGSVPHGGFGLGFDRLLNYLSGVSNIRDIVAFPRWYGRCDC